jgi:NAD(P)-dependent dehydrogenase (short-subunit alcohol dehydrogenase family)
MRRQRETVSGRTVFITGASRGIGPATARRLHRAGANVSLVGLEPELLSATAAELGERARFFHADVTDSDALAEAASATIAAFGAIDVVVANAGIAPPTTTIADIGIDDFERTLNVNLMGVWRTVKSTVPYVIASHGHIVLVSSMYAFFNGVLNASYAVSKAGVDQLGRALRVELAPKGATAGTAYFGFIDTDMVDTPASAVLRKAFPAFITKPATVDQAVDKMIDNIELRSPRVSAPGWVMPAMYARGLVAGLDHRLARDARVHAAIAVAEQA